MTDLQEALKDPPDGVVVATNGPSHAAVAIAVMEAGVRRILVEKPLCTSLDDARHLEDTARRTGTRLIVNVSRRYSEDYRRLVEWATADDGPLGPIVAFQATLGASGLACNGTHVLDLGMQFLGAPPARVWGSVRDVGLPNPRGGSFHDPGGWAVLETGDGRRLEVEMSDDFGHHGGFRVVGRWGRMDIDEIGSVVGAVTRDPDGRAQPLSRIGAPLVTIEPPVKRLEIDVVAWSAEAQKDLFGDDAPGADVGLGRDLLHAIVAIHMSSETERAVGWDEVPVWAEGKEFRFT